MFEKNQDLGFGTVNIKGAFPMSTRPLSLCKIIVQMESYNFFFSPHSPVLFNVYYRKYFYRNHYSTLSFVLFYIVWWVAFCLFAVYFWKICTTISRVLSQRTQTFTCHSIPAKYGKVLVQFYTLVGDIWRN